MRWRSNKGSEIGKVHFREVWLARHSGVEYIAVVCFFVVFFLLNPGQAPYFFSPLSGLFPFRGRCSKLICMFNLARAYTPNAS